MHFTMSKENDCGLDLRTDKSFPSPDSSSQDKYPEYCRTLKVKDNNGLVKELVFPKALDLDRPKRARTTFSAEQLYYLEQDFQRNQYLVGRERTELAHRLNLSETQVKVWFQNRRTKYKRDKVREAEDKKQNAESLAACNILRLLQGTQSGSTVNDSPSALLTKSEKPQMSINSPVPMPSMPFLHLPMLFPQHDLPKNGYKP